MATTCKCAYAWDNEKSRAYEMRPEKDCEKWDRMGYDWRDAVNDLTPVIAKRIAKNLGL